jgi:tetratricopeptide (TPR) repeat protein
MSFFSSLCHNLRRCCESSPKTLLKRAMHVQQKLNSLPNRTDDQAQSLLQNAAQLFFDAAQRCRDRNDKKNLVCALFSLANTEWELYTSAGEHYKRLDNVIAAYEEALGVLLPVAEDSKPSNYRDLLTNTAHAYNARFEQWHDRSDVGKSIELYEKALYRTQYGSPENLEILQIIGSIYWKLYRTTDGGYTRIGNEMERAVSYFQRAYDVCTAENRSAKANCAYNLACISYAKFQKQEGFLSSNTEEYLSQAISFYRSSIESMQNTHSCYPQALRAISLTLWYRYDQHRQEEDLQDAQYFATLALNHHSVHTEEHTEEHQNLTSIVAFASAPNANAAMTSVARVALRRATLDTVDTHSQNPGPTSPLSPSGFRAEVSPFPVSPARSVRPYEVDDVSDEQPPLSPAKTHVGRLFASSPLRVSNPPWIPASPKAEHDAPRVPKLVINTRIVRP